MNRKNTASQSPDHSRLLDLLDRHFNLDELRELCFRLDVDFDNLGGEGKRGKARELLRQLEREKRLEALLAEVGRLRPQVDWRGGPRPDAACPYMGLHAFGEKDAENFFGRETFADELLAAVNAQSLVAVVGPSGSGKSSVVFAGLVPKLRAEGGWLIAHFRPGSDPFLSLAQGMLSLLDPEIDRIDRPAKIRKLADHLREGGATLGDYLALIQQDHPDAQLLLICDQFEELYTQVAVETRREFLDVLLAEGRGLEAQAFATLVLTLRADFMGQALAYPPMVAALQNNDLKIGLMSRDDLTRAIEQPALNQGVGFEEGLVARILSDVGDHAGNLPLLEFALTLLWDRQSVDQMTHQAYESIHGVSGALAQHADETLERLIRDDPELEGAIQRVMVQLVHPGAGAEDTRRIARRSELGDEGWTLVPKLADARLLVTGREAEDATKAAPENEETVEVIHEALIQNWGRLKDWMARDREFRMWQDRLRDDLRLWKAHEEAKGFLLRGSPLTVAGDWLDQRPGDLTAQEIAYIEASIRQRKGDIYRRIAIGAAVVALLIAASIAVAAIQSQARIDIGIEATRGAEARETAVAAAATSVHNEELASQSEQEAMEAQARAEVNEKLANARWLVSQGKALGEDDPLLGLVLVLEALALADEIDRTEEILAEGRQLFQWGRQSSLGQAVEEIHAFEDGSSLVFAYQDKTAEWWDMEAGELIHAWPDADILDVRFFDSRFLAVDYLEESGDRKHVVYDVEVGQWYELGGDGRIDGVDFYADEGVLVTFYANDVSGNLRGAEVYRLQTGEHSEFSFPEGYFWGADFHADFRYFVGEHEDDRGRFRRLIYDVETGQRPDFVSDGQIGSVDLYVDDRYMVVEFVDDDDSPMGKEIYDLQSGRGADFVDEAQIRDVDLHDGERFMVVVYMNEEGRVTHHGLYDVQSGQRPDFLADGRIRYVYFYGGDRFVVVEYIAENGDWTHSTIYDTQFDRQLEFVADGRIGEIELYAQERFLVVDYLDENGDWIDSDLYDLRSEGQLEGTTDGRIEGRNVTFHADDRLMVVPYIDERGNLIASELYDVQTGRRPDFVASDRIRAVNFYGADRLVAVERMDESGTRIDSVLFDVQTEEGLDLAVDGQVVDVDVFAEGRFVVVEYEDEAGERWAELHDAGAGHTPAFVADGRIRNVSFDANDRFMEVAYTDGSGDRWSQLYDVATGRRPAFMSDDTIRFTSFDGNGRFMEVTYLDESGERWVELYDVETGQRPDFVSDEPFSDVTFVTGEEIMYVDFRDESGNWTGSEIYALQTGRQLDFVTDRFIEEILHADERFVLVGYKDENGDWIDSAIYDIQSGRRLNGPADSRIWALDFYVNDRYLLAVHESEFRGESYGEIYDIEAGQWLVPPAAGLNWADHISTIAGFILIEYSDARGYYGGEIYDIATGRRPEYIRRGRIQDVNSYGNGRILLIDYESGDEVAYDLESESVFSQGRSLSLRSLADDGLTKMILDGENTLWRITVSDTVPLAPMGANVADSIYISATHQIAVRYADGSAFLLNLDWLEAMNGEAASLPAADLTRLACANPLRDSLPPESLGKLEALLAQIYDSPTPRLCEASG